MTKKKNSTVLTLLTEDVDSLQKLIAGNEKAMMPYYSSLIEEMRKATVVPKSHLPADVVIMNSTVQFLDLAEPERMIYTIVYPWDADPDNSRISILAPLGTALLGYRKGDIIDWSVPSGIRRLKIEDVQQPV